MGIYANLLTAFQYRTSGAAREFARTDVLAKWHQQLVDFRLFRIFDDRWIGSSL
jgi:hypothetical protein